MLKVENRPSESDKSLVQKKISDNIQRELARIEAALYAAGRPLDLKELCSVLRTHSRNKTQKYARMLMKEYANRNTAIEILELKDERYVLQLKSEFTPHVKKLVKKPLLTRGPLKTLAYIAYRQPVTQKRVAAIRGHHAYSHMKQLKEIDLIVGKRKRRSTILTTTKYFADYFGLSHELSTMKRQLKRVFEQEITTDDK